MKYCPTCNVRYDEEILRFCTKCGTPLVSETQPSFTALPSEASVNIDDDLGADTVIVRKKRENSIPMPQPSAELEEDARQRIVVPTSSPEPEVVRANPRQQFHQPPPKKSNTALTVLLTLFGTLAVIGSGFGVWWMISGNDSPNSRNNSNLNANQFNSNLNTNISNSDSNVDNSNFNLNINPNSYSVNSNVNSVIIANSSSNANANKTPKPTPKPTAKPSNANTNANLSANSNSITNKPANTQTPTPSPTPPPTPKPTATPANTTPKNTTPKNVPVGNLNGRAVSLPKPAYPSIARQAGAFGQVTVQVTVDEEGNVLSAKAVNGNPLLRSPAEAAAKQARFGPKIAGDYAKATGTLVYNFQIR
jgi:TonB family protein